LTQPAWAHATGHAWLAVPLVMSDDILGFVVMAEPRAPITLNWECFDLLLTIGRQGASWLAEEIAARALADSRMLFEYSKRFSFVAHDVKNVSSQLGIMIANMRQFGDQPEFRADMVRTMEASIQRLNNLLGRLNPKQSHPAQFTDLAALVESVLHNLNSAAIRFEKSGASASCETISDHDLQSVLTHVITNSIEASEPDEPVVVTLSSAGSTATITVEDKGCGMEPAFVRDELFTPLRTTKRGGHGVGAFQARELVRAAGGTLDVTSAPRQGTKVRITLPLGRALSVEKAAAARI
jgi:putative PEP-CTERM system histidine kinase